MGILPYVKKEWNEIIFIENFIFKYIKSLTFQQVVHLFMIYLHLETNK